MDTHAAHETASATRILVLTSSFPRDAHDEDSLFLLRLCQELQHNGWHVRVLAPHAPGLKMVEELRGVPVHRYRYLPEQLESLAYGEGIIAKIRRNPFRIFQAVFLMASQQLAVTRMLKTHAFDVIHAHWIIPQGLAAALASRKFGIPAVGTTHGSDMLVLKGGFVDGIKRFVLKRMRALTVMNSAMRDIALAYNPELPVTVAPMGVDCEQFRPSPAPRSGDTVHLLFVGYLVPLKGAALLLEAMQDIVRVCPHVCLTIAGGGPQLRELQIRAEKKGIVRHVRFPGHIPNHQLPGLYARSDIFVSGSLSEGMPVTFLEAMASGCPIICGDIPGIRDLVREDVTGHVVPLNDAAALAVKTIELIRNSGKRKTMAIEARKSVEENFSWPAVGRRYAKILRSYASDKESRPGTENVHL